MKPRSPQPRRISIETHVETIVRRDTIEVNETETFDGIEIVQKRTFGFASVISVPIDKVDELIAALQQLKDAPAAPSPPIGRAS